MKKKICSFLVIFTLFSFAQPLSRLSRFESSAVEASLVEESEIIPKKSEEAVSEEQIEEKESGSFLDWFKKPKESGT